MNNPTYKFFYNELESHEIPRYSNGNPIVFDPSTAELKAGATRIIKALEARGYRAMVTQQFNTAYFSKPEYCFAAYVGTTVNQFSFNHKIWHWSNQFAISSKRIVIHEVYRGNGTSTNATFRLSVMYSNADTKPIWRTMKHHPIKPVNDFGITVPTTVDYVTVGGKSANCIEIRKFKPDVSDKVLERILDKAQETIDSIELFNPICYEADCSAYPRDNSKEYWEYRRSLNE